MKDLLLKGLINDGEACFYAISGRNLVDQARIINGATPTCTAALGRSLMAASILGAMEKNDRDEASLIIDGGGPAGKIICVGRQDASVKGYIHEPDVDLPSKANGKLDVGGAVGCEGHITVIRDLGYREPYIGRTRLISGEIAEDVAAYFAYSQQQPTVVYLGVHISRDYKVSAACGLIVQTLPGCSDEMIDELERRATGFDMLTNAVKAGQTLEDACTGVFDGLTIEFIDQKTPEFKCDCSRERLERVIINLGAKEIEDMIEKDGGAQLTCHFCQKKYDFGSEALQYLLNEARGTGEGAVL